MDFDKINIEDLYREAFDGARAKPGENVWEGIENKMKSESYIREQFRNYKVAPGSQVWYNIQRRLNLIDFFRFSFGRFNIYYLTSSIIILLLSGSVLFSYLNPVEGSGTSIFLTTGSDIKRPFTHILANESAEIRDITHNQYYPTLNAPEDIITENSINQPSPVGNIINRLNNNDIATVSEASFEGAPAIDISEEIADLNINQQEDLNIITLNRKEPVFVGFINPSELIPECIIFRDTFGFDVNGNPIVARMRWALDLSWSPAYNERTNIPGSTDMGPFASSLTSATSPSYSGSANLHISASYKNVFLESGVNYASFGELFAYNENIQIIDSSIITNTVWYQEYLYDTVWFVNLDSLIAGDTVYIPLVDSTIHKYTVDEYSTEYDTSVTKTSRHSTNRYRYIEIPLMAGYTFKSGRFSLTPKGGLITGLLIRTSGKTLMPDYSVTGLSESNQPYVRPVFSLAAGIGISYMINSHFSVIADPYYRKNITSVFTKDYPVDSRFTAYGIRVGLRYTF